MNLESGGMMTRAVTKDCFLFLISLALPLSIISPLQTRCQFRAPPSNASPGITHGPGHITSYHVSVHWLQGYQVIWPSSVLYTACA